jgi:hypothetical protein
MVYNEKESKNTNQLVFEDGPSEAVKSYRNEERVLGRRTGAPSDRQFFGEC